MSFLHCATHVSSFYLFSILTFGQYCTSLLHNDSLKIEVVKESVSACCEVESALSQSFRHLTVPCRSFELILPAVSVLWLITQVQASLYDDSLKLEVFMAFSSGTCFL